LIDSWIRSRSNCRYVLWKDSFPFRISRCCQKAGN